MNVLLVQIDGKLPNIALMKLAHWHRSRGDTVHYTKRVERDGLNLFGHFDRVYGSAIFSRSAPLVAELQAAYPGAVVGGTWNTLDNSTVEQAIGADVYEHHDYSIYRGFEASIGFTQRGCRLKCGFCVVPRKEGKPRSVNRIADIWRGDPNPKHIHLLDNDFFGQPRPEWEARIQEMVDGGFKVCLNQGINVRMIDDAAAEALSLIRYRDDQFARARLYTAWDNIGDERKFFEGVERLAKHGVPPSHLMVFMLVGYDQRETWERIFYRFNRMVEMGIKPYPMPHNENRAKTLPLGGCNQNIAQRTLGEFQRWVIRGAYRNKKNPVPFEAYDVNARGSVAAQVDGAQTDIFAGVLA